MDKISSSQNKSTAIRIEGLVKAFDEQTVLDRLDLAVGDSAVVHISGKSGSGKTTLLRCIAGLEHFSEGKISIHGKCVQSEKIYIKPYNRHIGMVFQQLLLFPHLTVYQNIDFVSKAIISHNTERKSWNTAIMQQLKIQHKSSRYPHTLSGGEKQRVAIARALAHRPDILLLDEPFSHLDNHLKDEIFTDLLAMIQKEKITCVIVSHQGEYFTGKRIHNHTLVDGKII